MHEALPGCVLSLSAWALQPMEKTAVKGFSLVSFLHDVCFRTMRIVQAQSWLEWFAFLITSSW